MSFKGDPVMRSSESVKPITDFWDKVLTSPKLSLSLILTVKGATRLLYNVSVLVVAWLIGLT